jgi:hypothetical protein
MQLTIIKIIFYFNFIKKIKLIYNSKMNEHIFEILKGKKGTLQVQINLWLMISFCYF